MTDPPEWADRLCALRVPRRERSQEEQQRATEGRRTLPYNAAADGASAADRGPPQRTNGHAAASLSCTRCISIAASDQKDSAGDHGRQPVVVEDVVHHPAETERGENFRHHDEEVENAHVDADLVRREAAGEDRIGHGERAGPRDSDAGHGEQEQPLVVNQRDGKQARGAAQQADASAWSCGPSRAASAGSANEKAKQTAEYIAKQKPPHSTPSV